MKFFYLAVFSIFLASCSTVPTAETNTNSASSVNSANSKVAAIEQTNTNVEVQTASNTANSNTVKIKSGGVINRESFEALKQTKTGDPNLAPVQAETIKNIAPGDSEISSTMNSQGVPIETRTFKNDPLLDKVEKILADPKNPQVKIYLKNGKVVNLPASKIGDSAIVSANEILIAAGAIPKTAPSGSDSKEKLKNGDN